MYSTDCGLRQFSYMHSMDCGLRQKSTVYTDKGKACDNL